MRSNAERDRANAEEAERALRQTRWACDDSIRLKYNRIAELVAEKTELNKANSAMAEEYERKMGELLQSLHEVEKAFVSQRASHEESLAKQVTSKDEELRTQREKLTANIDSLNDKLVASETRVETLESQLSDSRADFESTLKKQQEAAKASYSAAVR